MNSNLNFNFDINQELLNKYRDKFERAVKKHAKIIMMLFNEFEKEQYDESLTGDLKSFYPTDDDLKVYYILYSIISEMIGDNISFGDFDSYIKIARKSIKSDSNSESIVDLSKVLLSKFKSVDWNLFPKEYIKNIHKVDEINTALNIFNEIVDDSIFDTNDCYDPFRSWQFFYDYYLKKAEDINREMHNRELFGTVPEKLLALGLISRRLGVVVNLPIYFAESISRDNINGIFDKLVSILKNVFEQKESSI